MPEQERPVLGGRYELYRRIARGGMAEVFLAKDQLLDRPVAVKVLFPEFATDSTFVERFRREAQAAANLSHPNIAGVYDWGQESGTYYIVMEYVEGRSLAEMIRSEGAIDPERTAEIAIDVAAALAFAHRSGVVHRDIKPGNILISSSGQVKVVDFGIARAISATSDDDLTQTGAVMGTATYLSPEQARGQPADPRSDIYSLAVVMYEMLTGQAPFTGDTPVAIAYKHVQETVVPPSDLNRTLEHSLEAIVLKGMAKAPPERYGSAEELRSDLRRHRAGEPVLAAEEPGSGGTGPIVPPPVVPPAEPPGFEATTAFPTSGPPTVPPGGMPPGGGGGGYEEEPRRTGLLVASMVGAVAIVAVLVFMFAQALSDEGDADDGPALIEVPDVVGEDQIDAESILRNAGFLVSIETEESDEVPEGEVIRQNPRAGAEVEEGTEILLTVSGGLGTVEVPQLVDLTEEDARDALRSLDLIPDPVYEFDDEAEEGIVIAQDPRAGIEVEPGSSVVITISSGSELIEVPDVVGSSQSDAELALARSGFFEDVVIQEQFDDEVPQGDVIAQNPAAGTPQPDDTVFTLTISRGPELIEIPIVSGTQEAIARAELEALRFGVSVTYITLPANSPDDGLVISVTPAEGTAHPPGTLVTLRVGEAAEPPATTTTTTTTTAPTTTTTGDG